MLRAPDGTDLGEFNSAVPDWGQGDVFELERGRRLRIVSVAPCLEEDADAMATWTVEPVGLEQLLDSASVSM
jgi:hypothetical protein